MLYYLMRKNDLLTAVDIDNSGEMIRFEPVFKNPELAPLHDPNNQNWLKDWWKKRSIPVSQDGIRQILEQKGFSTPEEYLTHNLGLSLTDYYWILPEGSSFSWEDINLYDNDFKENLILATDEPETGSTEGVPHYTPNGSLQGSLEKTWMIINGERCLLKGNRDNLSSEALNEIIASRLHELQEFDNYTRYYPLEIHNRDYDYGCYSKLFTSQRLELISAYTVVTSEKKPGDISYYEHFINICGQYGIDKEQLRMNLEYQIMTDFILSGRDRHLSNISVLRDADTLHFLRMAPIYDSGKCLFVHDSVPQNNKELLNIRTESFASSELGLLKYVQDRSLVDVSRLPGRKFIESVYSNDSQINESRIRMIGEAYEKKVALFEAWQKGEDLNKFKAASPKTRINTLDELINK